MAASADAVGPHECPGRRILGDEDIRVTHAGEVVNPRTWIEVGGPLKIPGNVDIPYGVGGHRTAVLVACRARTQRPAEARRGANQASVEVGAVLAGS